MTLAEQFQRDSQEFRSRILRLGNEEVSRYYWYHTISLPGGLVTPGVYDFRSSLPCFQFPQDMRGMSVLDVGSATGFFAFELERRGALVTSVETPSLEALDRFPGQTVEQSVEKIQKMIGVGHPKYTAEELYRYLLDGPFEFCRNLLNSKVERCFSSVYDVPAKLGNRTFDLVFMGDILLHTLYPLQALAAVTPLCKGRLVLSQVMPEAPDGQPAMQYVGGDDPVADEICWWLPNQACMAQLLKKLGFREVREVGRNTGQLRPSGYPYDRPILHAIR